jgi:hypothetical protein
MITYTAINTKTGQFYIGSSKNYCGYMNRIGNHHAGSTYNEFRKHLQADPESFIWEHSEDESDDREFEASLLEIYVGNKWCYNRRKEDRFNTETGRDANHNRVDVSRTLETRKKMSDSAFRTSEIKSETMTRIVNTVKPCPNCGKPMNPGNLSQHLRRGKCV